MKRKLLYGKDTERTRDAVIGLCRTASIVRFFLKFTFDCKNIFENSMRFAEGITWETDIFFSAQKVLIMPIYCLGFNHQRNMRNA